MQKFIITGGKRLSGELVLQGSKNSCLPIMAVLIPGIKARLDAAKKLRAAS